MPGVQRLNVLVVDRDEDSAAHWKGFLAEEGFRAASLKDTATAVDEIKRGRYPMVLQALELPATGDGSSCCRGSARSTRTCASSPPRRTRRRRHRARRAHDRVLRFPLVGGPAAT